jgi:hypothetical protein
MQALLANHSTIRLQWNSKAQMTPPARLPFQDETVAHVTPDQRRHRRRAEIRLPSKAFELRGLATSCPEAVHLGSRHAPCIGVFVRGVV